MISTIHFAALGPIDDDVRLTWIGEDGSEVVLSDTRWNIGWYYGDQYLGPGGNPNASEEGFRQIFVINPEVPLPGRIVVEAFDGWASRWRISPWTMDVTHRDGHVETFTGGETLEGTAPHDDIISAPGYYSTGPHYNDYRSLGETGVIRDRTDPTEPPPPVAQTMSWPEALALARQGRLVRRSWWGGDKAITFERGDGDARAVATLQDQQTRRPMRASEFRMEDYYARDWTTDES